MLINVPEDYRCNNLQKDFNYRYVVNNYITLKKK